jgi:hypothetical protein
MTVQNTNRKDVYLTNGTTIYWPYTFEIFTTDGSDLALYETNLTTGETKLIDTNLTRDIINSRIKYPRTGSPRPEGYKITVARITERTQGIDLETQSFDPKNMERGLDKLTAMVQEIDETVSRAAVADISQQGVNFTFPSPVGGKVIGWNAEGTGLINLDNTTLGIEAQMLAATEAAQTAADKVDNLVSTAFEEDGATIKKATHWNGLPNLVVSNWTPRTVDLSDWRSVCWSPELGLFVAVAAFGTTRVMTSPDGINWTPRSAAANNWRSICWSPELGLFVAVADYGTNQIMTSPDGTNWTARSAVEANDWWSVCWSPELELFVAVASSGTNRVMTSPDGINWTPRTVEANGWRSVCWSPELGLFVAVAAFGTTRVMTSPDGINWTPRTVDLSDWRSVCWSPELGLFVAVADSGTNRVITSPDGINWTPRTVEANSWWSICWSPELGLFVAVAFGGTNRVMTSPDGINWTPRTVDLSDWRSVCWSPELGLFVAVASDGTNRVMTSLAYKN